MPGYKVFVLKEGFSHWNVDTVDADGTITLIKGKHNILVDCGSPWDKEHILLELEKHRILPNGINYMVCTHGHTDHVGNLNLFSKAVHINGDAICRENSYTALPFEQGLPFKIDEYVEILQTPGHTQKCISVMVRDVKEFGTIIIAGDLFEKKEDIDDPSIWMMNSEDVANQRRSRLKVLDMADYIIPGHGPIFKVTEEMRQTEFSYELGPIFSNDSDRSSLYT